MDIQSNMLISTSTVICCTCITYLEMPNNSLVIEKLFMVSHNLYIFRTNNMEGACLLTCCWDCMKMLHLYKEHYSLPVDHV
jgi:hypothetical protein